MSLGAEVEKTRDVFFAHGGGRGVAGEGDKDRVLRVHKLCRMRLSMEVFVDQEDGFGISFSTVSELDALVSSARVVAVYVSVWGIASQWTAREVRTALSPASNTILLPVFAHPGLDIRAVRAWHRQAVTAANAACNVTTSAATSVAATPAAATSAAATPTPPTPPDVLNTDDPDADANADANADAIADAGANADATWDAAYIANHGLVTYLETVFTSPENPSTRGWRRAVASGEYVQRVKDICALATEGAVTLQVPPGDEEGEKELAQRVKRALFRILAKEESEMPPPPPPPPETYLSRDREEAAVADLLLMTGPSNLAAVHAVGGAGKSLLARAVAWRKEIQSTYSLVLWKEVGERATSEDDLKAILLDLVTRGLGGLVPDHPSLSALHTSLRTELSRLSSRGRTVLLILDDVWVRSQFAALGSVFLETGHGVLVTTRTADVLPRSAPQGAYVALPGVSGEMATDIFLRFLCLDYHSPPPLPDDMDVQAVVGWRRHPLTLMILACIIDDQSALASMAQREELRMEQTAEHDVMLVLDMAKEKMRATIPHIDVILVVMAAHGADRTVPIHGVTRMLIAVAQGTTGSMDMEYVVRAAKDLAKVGLIERLERDSSSGSVLGLRLHDLVVAWVHQSLGRFPMRLVVLGTALAWDPALEDLDHEAETGPETGMDNNNENIIINSDNARVARSAILVVRAALNKSLPPLFQERNPMDAGPSTGVVAMPETVEETDVLVQLGHLLLAVPQVALRVPTGVPTVWDARQLWVDVENVGLWVANHWPVTLDRGVPWYVWDAVGDARKARHDGRAEVSARKNALAAFCSSSSPTHSSALLLRFCLAGALVSIGSFDQARDEYETVLDVQSQIYGPNHPSTLATRTRLAELSLDASFSLAEMTSVLAARQEIFGPNHAATLMSRAKLAGALRRANLFDRACQEYQTVLQIYRETLDENHPSVLVMRFHLAKVYQSRGDYAVAKAMFDEIYDAEREIFGEDNPQTLTTRDSRADVLVELARGQDDRESAKAEYLAVLQARERVLGPTHFATLRTRRKLAQTLTTMAGEFSGGISTLYDVLDTQIQVLGADHKDAAGTRSMIKDAERSHMHHLVILHCMMLYGASFILSMAESVVLAATSFAAYYVGSFFIRDALAVSTVETVQRVSHVVEFFVLLRFALGWLLSWFITLSLGLGLWESVALLAALLLARRAYPWIVPPETAPVTFYGFCTVTFNVLSFRLFMWLASKLWSFVAPLGPSS